jgi:probable addiction module antidote protein
MPLDTQPYDSADHLRTPEHVAAYLDAVLEENDPALLAHALGVVARAKGMTGVAEATGRSRAQLYRSRSEGGNPQLDTLMGVLGSLGLRLSVQPVEKRGPEAA